MVESIGFPFRIMVLMISELILAAKSSSYAKRLEVPAIAARIFTVSLYFKQDILERSFIASL